MSRVSRIRHPAGARFVILYEWIVRVVGRDGAAIIGLLEFLDRAQAERGQRLASRARIIADLEGIATRQKIDSALALLVELGWIKRHDCKEIRNNIRTWHEYSLCANVIGLMTAGVPKWEEPAIEEENQSGSHNANQSQDQSWNQSELATYCKQVNQDQDEKQHLNLKDNPCDAAAPIDFQTKSSQEFSRSETGDSGMRPKRGDEIVLAGIEVWTERDKELVLQLIATHGVTRIEEVAAAIKPALGRSAPLPSAVVASLQETAAATARSKASSDAMVRAAENLVHVLPPEAALARLAEAKAQLSPRRSSS